MNITIRNINPQFWRDFKTEAVRKGVNIGEALNIALKKYLEELIIKKQKKQIDFFDLEPIAYHGKDEGHLAEKVDEIVYGWKK